MRHAVNHAARPRDVRASAAGCAALCLTGVAVLAGAAGCRRDAQAPLRAEAMFPDAGATSLTPPASAAGTLNRAELLAEVEPNNGPEEAQAVSGNALVTGELGPAALVAEPAPKTKKGKGKVAGDADWYRLPATPAGQLLNLDLREAPPGTVLELYDDTGRTLIARSRTVAGVRPVLPSWGAEAHASLVRVSVDPAAKGEGHTGPYKLAVFTRAAKPDEEQEPNATVKATTQAVGGALPTLSGTMAPEGDVDAFVLDLTDGDGSAVWVLDVTPVPGVALELQILDPASLKPLLIRKGGKDQGLTIPNLGTQRLPKRSIVTLTALTGQAPDQPYALSVRPLLPTGCVRQLDCMDRLPTEIEPNDTRLQAQQLQVGGGLLGFLDAGSDTDVLEVVSTPGAAMRVLVSPPTGTLVRLQVGDGPDALTVAATEPGAPLTVGGVASSTGRLGLVLTAVGEGKKPPVVNPRATWRLETTLLTEPAFEIERGDESHQAGLWTGEHVLLPHAVGPALPQGGWARSGALVPAGDVDAFGLDLRQRTGVVGVELQCAGDGAPGLTCTLLDNRGAELVHLAAGPADRPALAPVGLLPGLYRVVVAAEKPRLSPQPYHVTLRNAPEAAILPVAASPEGL